MGSIIDYIECPNCKTEAISDYYYKSGEEYINCNNCGYHYSATIKNREKEYQELTKEDWDIHEYVNPFGAYRLKYKESVSTQCGSLRNEAEWKFLKENVKTKKDVEYFTLSRLIEGKIIVKHII